ncbi:MAG: protein kinase [Candidatus Poribacteria bacterium]
MPRHDNNRILNQRYELTTAIASGGTGTIYKTRDKLLNRWVALKSFHYPPEKAHICRREAEIAASLSHPNIVTVHDIIESDGRVYLLMEYIDGKTLADLLAQRGRLSIDEAIEIGCELSKALGYAHARRIVHRDVNPNNIMLGVDGRIKLMDFGMALKAGIPMHSPTLECGGSDFGTLCYMPPECLMGKPGDARSDQFSLGAVLYRILAGVPPFVGNSVLAIAYRVLMENPPPIRGKNADVLERFEETIFQLLKKNPGERFRNMDEVRFNLQRMRRASSIRFYVKTLPQTKHKTSLEQLKSWVRESRKKGEGNVILIPGEQGIGKSLLVANLCSEMRQEGVLCLVGFADDSAETYPYFSFRDLFRNYCKLDDAFYHLPNLTDSELANIANRLLPFLSEESEGLLPFLMNLIGISFEEQGMPQLHELGEKEQEDNTHKAVRGWLRGAADDSPVIVHLDDLQWADPKSLDLFVGLFDLVKTNPITLIGTYRPERDKRCNSLPEEARRRCPEHYHQIALNRIYQIDGKWGIVPFEYTRDAKPKTAKRYTFADSFSGVAEVPDFGFAVSAGVNKPPRIGSVCNSLEWEFYRNYGGIIEIRDGSLFLASHIGEGGPFEFPFVRTVENPFPKKGNFAVRVKMQYLASRQNGAGFEICCPMPQNQTDRPIDYRPSVEVWQDNSGVKGLKIQLLETATFCISESPDLEPHQYEFRFFLDNGQNELQTWVDGKMVGFFRGNYPFKGDFPRPNGMWFGQYLPEKTSLGWSDFRVDWVEIIELE